MEVYDVFVVAFSPACDPSLVVSAQTLFHL